MIRPVNEREDLLFPITRVCQTLIYQTHTKPKETLEIKIVKPRKPFSFKPFVFSVLSLNG